ncbi:MAG: rhodanese-like domain-containing protein [Gammaproteobacteria bacterium]
MQILNIAGYKFIALSNLETVQAALYAKCEEFSLKGTILLSEEGINITLSGSPQNVQFFQSYLNETVPFAGMRFHETYSPDLPFKRLKVKIKPEIITLGQPGINAIDSRAPSISPQDFKQWLDEKRDITVLDTRNDYEVGIGTFTSAKNLHIDDFGDFPAATADIDKDKPVVMFCTGGIRCEKAAIYMQNQGFKDVYQLDGGILGYFAEVGGAHYTGDCFVFDDRVAVDPALNPVPQGS